MKTDDKHLFRSETIVFSIPEAGSFGELPQGVEISGVSCPRCRRKAQVCVVPGFFLMWCQCCIVSGPIPDFIRPLNAQDWTSLVLDEVDAANALKG
jgi:hypothetical protein